jgi:GNAT superfamily N-acetyltransferase
MSDRIPLKIIKIPALGGTPILGFAVRVHAAMLEEGWADATTAMVYHNTRAVVAMIEVGEPVGIITYDYVEHARNVNIGLGYVIADYRRRGIYKMMWSVLCEEARMLGAARVFSMVHAKNIAMLKVCSALDRRVESHNIVFDL